jgi:hypothetical protein
VGGGAKMRRLRSTAANSKCQIAEPSGPVLQSGFLFSGWVGAYRR